MTVMLPVGRACTRQLVSRSNYVFTRFASSNPLLRVSNRNPDNPTSSQSCYPSTDKRSLLTKLRTYATEVAAKPRGRPKGHTGRTVAKKSTAKAKATTSKKTPAKKTSAKKSKAGAKAKPKPKKKPKKPAVKRPPSKRALNRARVDRTNDLKTKALLSEPKQLPATAWNVYFAQAHKGVKNISDGAAVTKEAAERYKHLSPEEREQLNHTANQNKAKNEAEYKKWVSQHTPLEIKDANNARRRLNQEYKAAGRKKAPISQIKDDRLVKQPSNAYSIFLKDRFASGDFKQMALAEAARLIGREWKALSSEARKPFDEQAQADLNRYNEERDSVYQQKRTPGRRRSST